MIQGAIFDFDGTLFDSMFIWSTIGSDYLRSIGYEPQEDLNTTFKSMSLYQAACHYQSEYGVTLSVNEITDGVNHMIEHYYREAVQPKNGVEQLLKKLKDTGVRMCIATATDRHLIDAALERTGLNQYFLDIITCSFVGHGKDEPEIYRKARNVIGTEKKNTLVFEDAVYAVRTAFNDGFRVVGIYDKSEEHQAEVKALSNIYLPDFLELESFWKFASDI